MTSTLPRRPRTTASQDGLASPYLIDGRRYPLFIVGLVVAVVVVMLIGITYGSVHIPFDNVWRVVLHRLNPFDLSLIHI